MSSLEHKMAGLFMDHADVNKRLDRMNERIGRIEQRLQLIDAPTP